MRKCDNCKFFFDAEVQHCRRYPPTVRDAVNSSYPVTHPDITCGEHKFSLRRLFKRRKPKIEMDQG